MNEKDIYSALESAWKKSDDQLYELIGRDLMRGTTAGSEGLVVRASNWLLSKHNWIQSSTCGVDAIVSAARSRDVQALSYAIAVALTPPGSRDIVLYAWIAVLVVRIGIEEWCPKLGQGAK